jgi:3-hydroxybutyryl-CoA dehydrogenase
MSTEIKTVGVVGAGQMGTGIAQVAAQAGYQVLLADASGDVAERAKGKLRATLERLANDGKLPAQEVSAALGRIRAVNTLDELGPCNLVVEAVSEDFDLKVRLFRHLDTVVGPETILASNTSSISITRIAGQTRRAERVVGIHFMNPVPLMKLVEVIRGLQTSDATYATAMHLVERLNKTAITAKDAPAFVVNRMLMPLLIEACFAVQEGIASPEDIDTGVKLGLNHPMGPLELADFIGLDTVLAVIEVLHREFGDDKYRPANLLRQYVAAGWLGRKTGRGFYRYENGKRVTSA